MGQPRTIFGTLIVASMGFVWHLGDHCDIWGLFTASVGSMQSLGAIAAGSLSEPRISVFDTGYPIPLFVGFG